MTSRKKPGVAFWATAVLVVALAYPLSIGPFVWLAEHDCIPERFHDVPLFAPIQWIMDRSPQPVVHAIRRYIGLWR